MRVATKIVLTPEEHTILTQLSRSRKVSVRLAERAKIVLLAADNTENQEIAEILGITRQKVSRWRERYAKSGLMGIEKDAPRCGRFPSINKAKKDEVVKKTLYNKPTNATHWSRHSMAVAMGISDSSVGRIWRQNGLKPHLIKTFKLSNDPKFAEKLEDIIGLYLSPPEHAIVFSCDEKSQIQALDRTQPGLPLKKGRGATMTHDYKRNGTTTLFAAMNTIDGSVIGVCMKQHRNNEWLRFLKKIKTATPKEKEIHIICDNYSTHKHQNVKNWLAKNKRFKVHFTPTSSSWLNMVERFFRDITENRIRRGIFYSVSELEAAIMEYLEGHNENPKSFIWTAKAKDILEKVKRGRIALLNQNKLQSV